MKIKWLHILIPFMFILGTLFVSGYIVQATENEYDFDQKTITFRLVEKKATGPNENRNEILKQLDKLPKTGEMIKFSLITLGIIFLGVFFSIYLLRINRKGVPK